jgi:hypothetical protein
MGRMRLALIMPGLLVGLGPGTSFLGAGNFLDKITVGTGCFPYNQV